MSNYMVEAKSRENLRTLARMLRKHLNLDDVLYFPIVELLDVLTEIFDDFNYEIVEDAVLSKKSACRHGYSNRTYPYQGKCI